MGEPQPEARRVYFTIFFGFMWLLFLALWLILYAEAFSLIQNIGIFLLSLVIVGIIMVVLWVPWSYRLPE
ncbi:hypothetical protein FGU46_08630 [Methanobacterium sp. CWC-01]|uniref:hypothetical protein n=1 Tax=Methanobacterium aridiramus TaxID=2584467 RepID=UPI002578420C|nr:hypothetical protein [Methanobacterium sp. CWC-01]WJI10146.1 hypothetical protein FGU46_08630 [Methanobacterium sp. CWC-01]